jgi:hypothetical protein
MKKFLFFIILLFLFFTTTVKAQDTIIPSAMTDTTSASVPVVFVPIITPVPVSMSFSENKISVLSKTMETVSVTIYNVVGNVINKYSFNSELTIDMNILGAKKGIYVVKVKTADTVFTRKVVY